MRLVYRKDGREVKVGDEVTVGGKKFTVSYFARPHKPNAAGRVTVKADPDDIHGSEYYVSVINAEWIEREDR